LLSAYILTQIGTRATRVLNTIYLIYTYVIIKRNKYLEIAMGIEQSSPDRDWEEVLAEEGMPAELSRPLEVAGGDSLELVEPDQAEERAEQARIEEASEAMWDRPRERE
jgi:hypothetical protein